MAFHGEGAAADEMSVEQVRKEVPLLLSDIPLHKIYNVDETGEHLPPMPISMPRTSSPSFLIHACCIVGLFYRMLATAGNVVGDTRSRKGAKKAKDRLTSCIFWNATGTDFWKPVFIGKAKQPRCFGKHWTPKNIGALYYHNACSWMRSDIWEDMLKQFNRLVHFLLINKHAHSDVLIVRTFICKVLL